MKIIKRNGAEAEFDKSKIYAAVSKANNAVEPIHRISYDQIQQITDRVTEKCQLLSRLAEVEEIQDMV